MLEPVSHAHDAGLLDAVLASQEELLPWMPWAVSPTPASTRELGDAGIRGWDAGTDFHFVMLEGGTPVGVIGLNHLRDGDWEIHYWLRSDRTGSGLATEAGRALIDWAAANRIAERLILNAGMHNARSLAVAERLGFVRDGALEGGMEGGLGSFPAYTHHLDLWRPADS